MISLPAYGCIGAGEVGRSTSVVLPVAGKDCRHVGLGVVGTVGYSGHPLCYCSYGLDLVKKKLILNNISFTSQIDIHSENLLLSREVWCID